MSEEHKSEKELQARDSLPDDRHHPPAKRRSIPGPQNKPRRMTAGQTSATNGSLPTRIRKSSAKRIYPSRLSLGYSLQIVKTGPLCVRGFSKLNRAV